MKHYSSKQDRVWPTTTTNRYGYNGAGERLGESLLNLWTRYVCERRSIEPALSAHWWYNAVFKILLKLLYYLIRRYIGKDSCRVWNIAQKSEGCAKMIPALIVGACERVVVENSPNFKMLVRPSHIFLQMRVKDFPAKIQLSSASV